MRRMTWGFTLMIAAFVVVKWFHRDSTIYEAGYSWSKFSSIQNGMTPEEVARILGQSLSIETYGGDFYSHHQIMY